MRGKITKRELSEELVKDIDSCSRFVVSSVEPDTNLKDGLIWLNPINETARVYYNGKFGYFGNQEYNDSLFKSELETRTSTNVLNVKSNTVDINMLGFDKNLGHLEVTANGTRLYPEDYMISDDSLRIIKKSGFWSGSGGRTEFLFTYYGSVNTAKSTVPFLKPRRVESFYVSNGTEAAIPIDIEEFEKDKHKLEVFFNGIAIKEDVHFELNSTGEAIILLSKPKAEDEFMFRITVHDEPEYVVILPDGSVVEQKDYVHETMSYVVIQTSEPNINLRDGLIWINPITKDLRICHNSRFFTVSTSSPYSIKISREQPEEDVMLWYREI